MANGNQTNLSDEDFEIIVRTLLGEAAGESYLGKKAVAAVIENRANSGKYPNSPAKVALQPYQFSANNPGVGGNNQGTAYGPGSETYQDAVRAVNRIFTSDEDPTQGSIHYWNPNVVTPAWAKDAGFGMEDIGNHRFIKGAPVAPQPAERGNPSSSSVVAPQPAGRGDQLLARLNGMGITADKPRDPIVPPPPATGGYDNVGWGPTQGTLSDFRGPRADDVGNAWSYKALQALMGPKPGQTSDPKPGLSINTVKTVPIDAVTGKPIGVGGTSKPGWGATIGALDNFINSGSSGSDSVGTGATLGGLSDFLNSGAGRPNQPNGSISLVKDQSQLQPGKPGIVGWTDPVGDETIDVVRQVLNPDFKPSSTVPLGDVLHTGSRDSIGSGYLGAGSAAGNAAAANLVPQWIEQITQQQNPNYIAPQPIYGPAPTTPGPGVPAVPTGTPAPNSNPLTSSGASLWQKITGQQGPNILYGRGDTIGHSVINGGTVSQGANGLLNSITQNSSAWNKAVGKDSGGDLSTYNGGYKSSGMTSGRRTRHK